MSEPIIKVENLSKKFQIGKRESYYSLRDSISNLFDFSKKDGKEKEDFWALKDVNFEVKRGESVGIIGRNGAGKSTLLKILSQITPPTTGKITMRGRVASLLEVGTGFNPELTGRENIFLNGAILGMTREEIRRKFDEIVAFAEIEQFLDTPVKRYSSGMYMRLAFAVAAHLESEILIVDEVLAVGDAQFQKKCLGKMDDVAKKEGRTVLFVSHNMGAVDSLCNKVIWLTSGKVTDIGSTDKLLKQYLEKGVEEGCQALKKAQINGTLTINKVSIRNSNDDEVNVLKPNEPITVEIQYFASRPIKKPIFWVDIRGAYGNLFGASMMFDGLSPKMISGEGTVTCQFTEVTLLPQIYGVTIRVFASNGVDRLIPAIVDAVSFQVIGSVVDYGMKGLYAEQNFGHDTPLIVSHKWKFKK